MTTVTAAAGLLFYGYELLAVKTDYGKQCTRYRPNAEIDNALNTLVIVVVVE